MTAHLLDALTGFQGVTITVRHELPPASQHLMDTLGVTVNVDPRAARCVRDNPWTRKRRACALCALLDREVA